MLFVSRRSLSLKLVCFSSLITQNLGFANANTVVPSPIILQSPTSVNISTNSYLSRPTHWIGCLRYDLHLCFINYSSTDVSSMWDFAIRFPFGEQPTPPDEEFLDAATKKSILQQEVASRKTADSKPALSGDRQDVIDDRHNHRVTTEHATSAFNALIVSANEISSTDTQASTTPNTNMARWSFQSEQHKFKAKLELSRKGCPQRENDGLQPINDIDQPFGELGPETKLLTEAEEFAQSATHLTLTTPEHMEMENLCALVFAKLQSLKTTTPESLPPYNRHFRAKKHLQVLKTRLLPVAKHILHILAQTREGKRSLLELKLCRYIAEKYWPLPLEATTHLRIQEMYHNDMFKTGLQTQGKLGDTVSTKTLEDKQSGMETDETTSKPLPNLSTQLSVDDQQNKHLPLELEGMD